MIIPPGHEYKDFRCAMHEAMHAEGIPDKYMHDQNGCDDMDRLARFMWRWLHKNYYLTSKDR